MQNINIFINENREKFTTLLFLANAVILLFFIFFWGFGEMGYMSEGGLFSGISIVKAFYTMTFPGEAKLNAYWLLLIPASSIYMLYCVFTGTNRFIKIARIILVIGFFPVLTLILIRPFNALGLIISVLLAVSLFFSKKTQPFLNKLFKNVLK